LKSKDIIVPAAARPVRLEETAAKAADAPPSRIGEISGQLATIAAGFITRLI